MTLQEKLESIERNRNNFGFSGDRGELITLMRDHVALLDALRKCREQRNESLDYDQPNIEHYDKRLLAILSGDTR